jgi:transposase-like protein
LKSYSLEEKNQIIKEVKETGNISLVAQKHKVPSSTVHSWLKSLENKEINLSKKTLKNLEKQLADKDLEIRILRDLLKKTSQAWLRD